MKKIMCDCCGEKFKLQELEQWPHSQFLICQKCMDKIEEERIIERLQMRGGE
jgi:hypothetical protein